MRIYLIGFMGCGKSYWALVWSKRRSMKFLDLDEMIEEETHLSIAEIFQKKGEESFRIIEKNILHKTAQTENSIIACGGGTALFYDNLDWMKQNGTVVFLDESVEKLFERLKDKIENRPLLQSTEKSLDEIIKSLLSDRMEFYQQADIRLTSPQINESSLDFLFTK